MNPIFTVVDKEAFTCADTQEVRTPNGNTFAAIVIGDPPSRGILPVEGVEPGECIAAASVLRSAKGGYKLRSIPGRVLDDSQAIVVATVTGRGYFTGDWTEGPCKMRNVTIRGACRYCGITPPGPSAVWVHPKAGMMRVWPDKFPYDVLIHGRWVDAKAVVFVLPKGKGFLMHKLDGAEHTVLRYVFDDVVLLQEEQHFARAKEGKIS